MILIQFHPFGLRDIFRIPSNTMHERSQSVVTLNPDVAELPANTPFVIPVKPVLDMIGERESKPIPKRWIPVFTGMTGSPKRLSPEPGVDQFSIYLLKSHHVCT
jgi:hypothetical protein